MDFSERLSGKNFWNMNPFEKISLYFQQMRPPSFVTLQEWNIFAPKLFSSKWAYFSANKIAYWHFTKRQTSCQIVSRMLEKNKHKIKWGNEISLQKYFFQKFLPFQSFFLHIYVKMHCIHSSKGMNQCKNDRNAIDVGIHSSVNYSTLTHDFLIIVIVIQRDDKVGKTVSDIIYR